MNKIIVVLCAVLALTHAEPDRVDDYIKVNRDQYLRVLDGYDAKLAYFRQHYEGRVEAVGVQKDLAVASIVHTEERLTPLVLLNDFTKQCVTKYRGRVASSEKTAESITKCASIATTQLKTLLTDTIKVRNALENHLKNVFEDKVAKCEKHSDGNGSSCVSDVVAKTNKFTFENQKSFEYELEAAECLAKANVKRVVDCAYSVQNDVFTNLGQFEVLLDKCLVGEDDCKPCLEYTCAEAATVYGNYNDKTVANPLHGRTDNPKCLLLNIYSASYASDLKNRKA